MILYTHHELAVLHFTPSFGRLLRHISTWHHMTSPAARRICARFETGQRALCCWAWVVKEREKTNWHHLEAGEIRSLCLRAFMILAWRLTIAPHFLIAFPGRSSNFVKPGVKMSVWKLHFLKALTRTHWYIGAILCLFGSQIFFGWLRILIVGRLQIELRWFGFLELEMESSGAEMVRVFWYLSS